MKSRKWLFFGRIFFFCCIALSFGCQKSRPFASYIEEAKTFMMRTDKRAAISVLSEAIEKFPDSVLAIRYRAKCFFDLGKYDSALADAQAILNLNRNDKQAYLLRYKIYEKLGNNAGQVAALSDCLRIDPADVECFNNRGLLHDQSGEYDLAMADFNNAIDIDSLSCISYVNRALVFQDLKQYDKAINDCDHAISLCNLPGAYYAKGVIFLQLKNYETALRMFDEAVENDPQNGLFLKQRGVANYYSKKIDEACKDWEKASRLGDENASRYLYNYCH